MTVSPNPIAAAAMLGPDDAEIVIATLKGKIIALAVDGIPIKGRRARGVRLVRVRAGDVVARIAVVPHIDLPDDYGIDPFILALHNRYGTDLSFSAAAIMNTIDRQPSLRAVAPQTTATKLDTWMADCPHVVKDGCDGHGKTLWRIRTLHIDGAVASAKHLAMAAVG